MLPTNEEVAALVAAVMELIRDILEIVKLVLAVAHA